MTVTSQVYLGHYSETFPQHLSREGIRQDRPVGRPRQQRGMEWLRAVHRSPCESTLARHVPKALGALSLSIAGCSAPQTRAVAQLAASRSRKTNGRRFYRQQRALGSESGIRRTGLAEVGTGPKWVPSRDDSGAEQLDLGDRTYCRFVWRNTGEPRCGTH